MAESTFPGSGRVNSRLGGVTYIKYMELNCPEKPSRKSAGLRHVLERESERQPGGGGGERNEYPCMFGSVGEIREPSDCQRPGVEPRQTARLIRVSAFPQQGSLWVVWAERREQ